ncbi:MAG: diguanylate cyclase [Gammaproteobacteria bacterium]|nr:diguanylate cyclase [Gammaproteobacteria bacterium]
MPRSRSPLAGRRTLLLALLTLVVATLGFTTYSLLRLRTEALARSFDTATLHAHAFESYLTQSFNVINLTLAGIAETDLVAPDPTEAPPSLIAALRLAPYLRSLAMLDRDSVITVSSNLRNIGSHINHDGFLPPTQVPMEFLRIGSPWIGRDFQDGHPVTPEQPASPTDLNFLPVSRDAPLGDNRWVTLLAAVNTDYFLNYLQQSMDTASGTIEWLRYDGMILLSTDERQRAGAYTATDLIANRLSQNEIGQFEQHLSDGQAVLTAYRASRIYPFLVVIHRDREYALAAWRSEAIRTLIVISAVLLAAMTLAILYYVRLERAACERDAAEAALRQQAEFRLFYDLPFIGMGILAPQTLRWLTVNDHGCTILGYSRTELLKKTWLELLHLEERPADIAALEPVVSGEKTGFTIDQRLIHKDGAILFVTINVRSTRDAQGAVDYLVATFQDITERKRTEADLRIAATAFEAQEGMMVTDATGAILRVNQAFIDITGYTAADAMGNSPRLLKSGRHDAAFYAAMWDRIRRTGSWQGEIWDRRQNGEVFPQWLTITAVRDDARVVTHYVGTLTDITERKAAEDEIRHLAFYDPLTCLPNRRLLLDRLHQAIPASARNQRLGALLFIDLDHFKTLNDTFGHDQGDLLLQQVAQRLTASVRQNDTVARLGGDEFVVMLEDLNSNLQEATNQVASVGKKILANLNRPYSLTHHEHHSTPSIGITLFGHCQETVEELLKRADIAMYEAKAAGRNTLRFFTLEA